MHKMKAVLAVLAFALIATVLLPLAVYNFTAANEEFPLVTVYDTGRVYRYETAAATVGDFFSTVGITATSLDRISYPMDAPLYDGMDITINRAVRFYVSTDAHTPTPWTVRYGTTVAEVMTRVQDQYETPFLYNNDINRPIAPHDIIQLQSWRSREFTETVAIPFEVYENHTGAVRSGRTHVRQSGIPGEHEVTISVIYIGGEEDSRITTDTNVLVEPRTAIYDIGTARLGDLTNPNAPDFHYLRRIRMQATAYCACVLCTGRNPSDRNFGVTASGRRVEHGIVATDTSVIPFNTHLYVQGYGFALAADRGGAIVGNRIDLFMYSHADALRFGRRYVYVWVLG